MNEKARDPKPFPRETLAFFGDAKLQRYLSGTVQIVGGSLEDRQAAKEWAVESLNVKLREE